MVKQRVLGICCGYEDVVDHDEFRNDPMAQLFCGTSPPHLLPVNLLCREWKLQRKEQTKTNVTRRGKPTLIR